MFFKLLSILLRHELRHLLIFYAHDLLHDVLRGLFLGLGFLLWVMFWTLLAWLYLQVVGQLTGAYVLFLTSPDKIEFFTVCNHLGIIVFRNVDDHFLVEQFLLSGLDSLQLLPFDCSCVVWVDVELVGLDLFLPLIVNVRTHDLEQWVNSTALGIAFVRPKALGYNISVHTYTRHEP